MDELTNEAIAWLSERGRQLGVDFNQENAVRTANDLAYEEEVKKRDGSDTIEFDGQNCDDCEGWTPGDHRCSCGNRRVAWATGSGHSFKDPSIYAEAY